MKATVKRRAIIRPLYTQMVGRVKRRLPVGAPRASYTAELKDGVILVRDNDGDVSVTNDAEAVVHQVLTQFGKRRILYRDTDGRWDELTHDGERFDGFFPSSDIDRAKYGLT